MTDTDVFLGEKWRWCQELCEKLTGGPGSHCSLGQFIADVIAGRTVRAIWAELSMAPDAENRPYSYEYGTRTITLTPSEVYQWLSLRKSFWDRVKSTTARLQRCETHISGLLAREVPLTEVQLTLWEVTTFAQNDASLDAVVREFQTQEPANFPSNIRKSLSWNRPTFRTYVELAGVEPRKRERSTPHEQIVQL